MTQEQAQVGYVVLTVRQYAALERLHPITVYKRVKAGQVAGAVRHGRSIRIHVRVKPRETVSPR